MSELAAIIAAIGGVVTAVGVILIAYWSYRGKERATAAARAASDAATAAEESHKEIIAVGDKVFRVGEQLDGRLSELLASARLASRAEGVAAGEQAQRDRSSDAQP